MKFKAERTMLYFLFVIFSLSLLIIVYSKFTMQSFIAENFIVLIILDILIHINEKPFKYYSLKYKYLFFFFVWLFIVQSFYAINTYSPTWIFLVFPLIMPVIFLTNILQHLDKLNLFDSNYYWVLNISHSPVWQYVFLIIGAIYIPGILILLSGKSEKTKKITLYTLLIFFLSGLILKSYNFYFQYKSSDELIAGSGNLRILLGELSIIFTSIIIITQISKNVNLKFLCNTFLKYLFLIFEILLVLFIGLIFINIKLSSDANIIDKYSFPLFVLIMGFFIFLILELIKKKILNASQ